MDKGKALVRSYEADANAQKIILNCVEMPSGPPIPLLTIQD